MFDSGCEFKFESLFIDLKTSGCTTSLIWSGDFSVDRGLRFVSEFAGPGRFTVPVAFLFETDFEGRLYLSTMEA